MSEAPDRRVSEAEARFDRVRARAGAVLAPIVFLSLLAIPMPALEVGAHRLVAIAAMTVVLWISEAIPLAVTALLAPALAVALDVAPAKLAFAPFAHPLIFLFIGGFMLAEAMREHGVDRRVALWLLTRRFVRGSPSRALVAIALTAFGFSMWINNTATTAMMCPIAIGLCASIRARCPSVSEVLARQRRFEEGALITLACASSLGGVCTPVGTAPNMIAIAELDRVMGVHVDFLRWMVLALPVAGVSLVGLLLLSRWRFPAALERVEGLTDSVRRDLAALGPLRPAEYRTLAVFGLAVTGWLLPSLLRLSLGEDAPVTSWARRGLPEGVVVIPTSSENSERPSQPEGQSQMAPLLTWDRASAIDWGTVLLLGGGLALGNLVSETGLGGAIGAQVDKQIGSDSTLLIAIVVLVIFTTELVSNTATINMVLPVVIPLAVRVSADPVPIVLTATFAASYAFMLPVSTPPNAIAYGTGLVRLPTMVRFGAVLNLVGLVLLVAAGAWLLPFVRVW